MMTIKLGQRVWHPKHGAGEVIWFTKRPNCEYAARFKQDGGRWVTAFLSRNECWHRPKRIRKRGPCRKRRPIEIDHQPATLAESKAMDSLGLTLRQVREARAGA